MKADWKRFKNLALVPLILLTLMPACRVPVKSAIHLPKPAAPGFLPLPPCISAHIIRMTADVCLDDDHGQTCAFFKMLKAWKLYFCQLEAAPFWDPTATTWQCPGGPHEH
jgi:hypothetical protein